jgi:hypothetical protein
VSRFRLSAVHFRDTGLLDDWRFFLPRCETIGLHAVCVYSGELFAIAVSHRHSPVAILAPHITEGQFAGRFGGFHLRCNTTLRLASRHFFMHSLANCLNLEV